MSFLLSPMRRIPATTCTRAFSTTRASQLARVTVVGRIGTDPEFTETSSGQQMMKYVVGSNVPGSKTNETSWFRIVHFSPPDSKAAQYMKTLSKGTLVYLEGDISMRTYETDDGKKNSSMSIVQTKLDVLKRPVAQSESNDSFGV